MLNSLAKMVKNGLGLTKRESDGNTLPAASTPRELITQNDADRLMPRRKPLEHENPRHGFSPSNIKIPGIFSKNVWPYVIVGLFFNAKIQKTQMDGNIQVQSFKTFELSPEQLGKDTMFTAAVQKVTFNPMKDKHDTSYYMQLNSKRTALNLRDNGHKQTADRMEAVADFLQGFQESENAQSAALHLRETASRYQRKGPLDPIPQKMLDIAEFEVYQYSGVEHYADANSMAVVSQPNWIRHISEHHVIRHENAFTKAFFPTGNVSFDSRHATGAAGPFYGVKNTFEKDEALTGTISVQGKPHAYKERLQEFTQNTAALGLVQITKDQFNTVLSTGKPINVMK